MSLMCFIIHQGLILLFQKHSIPVSAIPCLHYRREKEKIAKNHEPVQNSGEEPVQSSESVPNQSTEPVKTNAYKSVQVQSSNSVPVSTSEAEPVQTNDRAPEPVQQNGGVEENVTQNGATTENPDQQPPNSEFANCIQKAEFMLFMLLSSCMYKNEDSYCGNTSDLILSCIMVVSSTFK